jgi:GAF domain-containing protein
MREDEAIAIIHERSGTFYDPAVVDAFARVYREITPDLTSRPELQNAMRRIRDVRAAIAPAAAPAPQPVKAATADDSSEELLAFVSLGRLAAGTPTIGDVGALAWGHLRMLFPGASLALFTRDLVHNAVVASYTAGPIAAAIAGSSIGVGQRVSGWVAANARTMVNADAQLDLDAGQGLSALSVPMIADGAVVGVMTLYAPKPFADDQRRRIEIIAPHLATAIASAETHARPRPALHLVAQRA